ncbi:BgTH12-05927 [Blumeria graminis f. sp. triticale]|uniref:BgTH12-05927 n=1 Tax=Blumeria graminis f. sp. triticale TaxID=1689686 RepID=A0A9W4D4U8_BLUGR|nr:BgTH12-05927 [Blumeria graminis f. sp. triticale]
MTSSAACALSGTLIIAGGWLGVMWVGLITLALHLQICWNVAVGPVFTRATLVAGWSVPAVAVGLALKFCGVSFRLAAGCHVNAANSLPVLWVPLLLVAALTLIVQLATFAYCGRVYLATLRAPSVSPPLPHSARRPLSPKDTYHHVRRLVQLQWRAILIVSIIVADIVFFAVVFLAMNRLEAALAAAHETVRPWLVCLIATSGRGEACSAILQSLRPNESTLISVLALLSVERFLVSVALGPCVDARRLVASPLASPPSARPRAFLCRPTPLCGPSAILRIDRRPTSSRKALIRLALAVAARTRPSPAPARSPDSPLAMSLSYMATCNEKRIFDVPRDAEGAKNVERRDQVNCIKCILLQTASLLQIRLYRVQSAAHLKYRQTASLS